MAKTSWVLFVFFFVFFFFFFFVYAPNIGLNTDVLHQKNILTPQYISRVASLISKILNSKEVKKESLEGHNIQNNRNLNMTQRKSMVTFLDH